MTFTGVSTAPGHADQQTIPVDLIDPDPAQPRKFFDHDALAELGTSMKELGQLQPVTVRPNNGSGRFTLIMGERRWRAAQTIGMPDLYALVLHDVDEADAFIRAVAENVGRADMTPMEEAQAFHRLVGDGRTPAQVAAACGRTVEYVRYRIDLLNLIGPAAAALNAGHLPVGTAWYVAKLSPAAQQRLLRKWVRGEFPTARDAEAFAQACRTAEADVQGGFFVVEEMTPERREHIERRRRQFTARIDRLASAGQILSDLAHTDPAELALLLSGAAGGVGGYRQRVEHLRDMAGKAAAILRRANALAAAAAPDRLASDAIF